MNRRCGHMQNFFRRQMHGCANFVNAAMWSKSSNTLGHDLDFRFCFAGVWTTNLQPKLAHSCKSANIQPAESKYFHSPGIVFISTLFVSTEISNKKHAPLILSQSQQGIYRDNNKKNLYIITLDIEMLTTACSIINITKVFLEFIFVISCMLEQAQAPAQSGLDVVTLTNITQTESPAVATSMTSTSMQNILQTRYINIPEYFIFVKMSAWSCNLMDCPSSFGESITETNVRASLSRY